MNLKQIIREAIIEFLNESKTEEPMIIYKGVFGKRNIDGTIRTAHPNVIGTFGSTNKKIAERYQGNEPLKVFFIPKGTTIETVQVDRKLGGQSYRNKETEEINNSNAQVVKLITMDTSGKETQYIIKDRELLTPISNEKLEEFEKNFEKK